MTETFAKDVLIHKRCIKYNTAKSISPWNTYTENLSQKILYLHQPHFGFGRNDFFFPKHCTLFQ